MPLSRRQRKAGRARFFREFNKPRAAPIKVSEHAKKRIVRRMGTGTDPYIIANRAWDKKEHWPDHWAFPTIPKHRYYKYGNCIFVFVSDRGGAGFVCTTIFGPFRPDGSWWEDEILKRVN